MLVLTHENDTVIKKRNENEGSKVKVCIVGCYNQQCQYREVDESDTKLYILLNEPWTLQYLKKATSDASARMVLNL